MATAVRVAVDVVGVEGDLVSDIAGPNADQEEFWSQSAGPKWVALQREMDHLLEPVLSGMLARADLQKGQRVLDIGCGAGTSSLRAHDLTQNVVGADISQPLLELARRRAEDRQNLEFVDADAETHPFPPAHFDHLVSRFGTMFFANSQAAFTNMANAMKSDASVTLACWGQIEANPYFKRAAKAARDVLGPMPRSDPDAPGPFAFRDPSRVLPILAHAGLKHERVEIKTLFLIPAGGLEGLARLCMSIGPIESAIRHFEAGEDDQQKIRQNLMSEFSRFEEDGEIRIPAEINFYSATKH